MRTLGEWLFALAVLMVPVIEAFVLVSAATLVATALVAVGAAPGGW